MTSGKVEKLARPYLQDIANEYLKFLENGNVPGCNVESTTFFAYHSSGVIVEMSLFLYDEMRLLAFSNPDAETNSVLIRRNENLANFRNQHSNGKEITSGRI